MPRLVPLLVAVVALAAPAAAQAPSDPRALDRDIARLRDELVKLGAAEQAGEGSAIGHRARLVQLNAQEAALRARIGANRDQLAKLLAALQTYQRNPPPPLLVNPRSARDAVRAAILIRAITPALQARGRAFAAQAQAIAHLRRNAAAASEDLFQAESDIADKQAEIERLTAEKLTLEHRAYGQAAVGPAVRALAARTGSVEAFVAALPSEGAAGPPAAPPDRLSLPVRGVLVRRFGEPLRDRERAQGWTWRAQANAAVIAPAAGRVDYAGPLKGWGEVVVLNLGGQRRLVLAGLEMVSAEPGRSVAAGEPVGRLGPAGQGGATPPELYLEIRGPGGALDPARFLVADAGAAGVVRR